MCVCEYSMYECVHVYSCAHACMNVWVCACACVCMHVHTQLCVNMCLVMCIQVCACMSVCLCVQVHMHTCVFRAHGWPLVLSWVLPFCVSCPSWSEAIGSYLHMDKLVQGIHLFLKSFGKHCLSKLIPILHVSVTLHLKKGCGNSL